MAGFADRAPRNGACVRLNRSAPPFDGVLSIVQYTASEP